MTAIKQGVSSYNVPSTNAFMVGPQRRQESSDSPRPQFRNSTSGQPANTQSSDSFNSLPIRGKRRDFPTGRPNQDQEGQTVTSCHGHVGEQPTRNCYRKSETRGKDSTPETTVALSQRCRCAATRRSVAAAGGPSKGTTEKCLAPRRCFSNLSIGFVLFGDATICGLRSGDENSTVAPRG
jgi:hypothetical protein